jgi:hypothetical protein
MRPGSEREASAAAAPHTGRDHLVAQRVVPLLRLASAGATERAVVGLRETRIVHEGFV